MLDDVHAANKALFNVAGTERPMDYQDPDVQSALTALVTAILIAVGDI